MLRHYAAVVVLAFAPVALAARIVPRNVGLAVTFGGHLTPPGLHRASSPQPWSAPLPVQAGQSALRMQPDGHPLAARPSLHGLWAGSSRNQPGARVERRAEGDSDWTDDQREGLWEEPRSDEDIAIGRLRGPHDVRLRDLAEVRRRTKERSHRLAGVGFFVTLDAAVKAAFGSTLSPVLGILSVFVLFAISKRIRREGDVALYKALKPGYKFLVKWVPIFVAPQLIGLALTAAVSDSWVTLRLSLLMALGLTGALRIIAAFSALFQRTVQRELQSRLATINTQQPDSASLSKSRLEQDAPERIYPRLGAPFKRRWLVAYAFVMYAMAIAATKGFANVVTETIFMCCSSLMGFVVGLSAPLACRKVVHPLLVCVLTTWLSAYTWARLTGAATVHVLQAYNSWPGAGYLFSCMLSPAFAALGVLLYKQRNTVSMKWVAISITSLLSLLASMISAAFLARYTLMHSSFPIATVASSIVPSSVRAWRGLHAVAEVSIVFTVFGGLMLGPWIFRKVGRLCFPADSSAAGAAPSNSPVKSLVGIDEEAFLYGLSGSCFTGAAIGFVVYTLPPLRNTLTWLLAA